MQDKQILEIATTLHTARQTGKALKQFSASIEDFKREDAYSIQEAGIKLRQNDGETVIGLKMGLTSAEKREQMNLDSPLYGVLTDKMQVTDGGEFKLVGSIHPKIEPEVAFYINKELKGTVSREDVLNSCSGVCAALEILDSRYEGFKYFSMEDVISDNSSSSHYILGEKLTEFSGLDFKNLKMQMLVNGEIAKEGISSAISGDPVVSVMQLSELLAKRGQSIPANCFVLAGAATTAVSLEPGMKVSLKVDHLPELAVNIGE